MNEFDRLKEIIAGAEDDARKFYDNGNKSAGVRLRKAMMDIKGKAQDVRTEVQDIKS